MTFFTGPSLRYAQPEQASEAAQYSRPCINMSVLSKLPQKLSSPFALLGDEAKLAFRSQPSGISKLASTRVRFPFVASRESINKHAHTGSSHLAYSGERYLLGSGMSCRVVLHADQTADLAKCCSSIPFFSIRLRTFSRSYHLKIVSCEGFSRPPFWHCLDYVSKFAEHWSKLLRTSSPSSAS
jgi:hypothetical protein